MDTIKNTDSQHDALAEFMGIYYWNFFTNEVDVNVKTNFLLILIP